MKTTIHILFYFLAFINYTYSQVGIGTNSPNTSAVLDLTSTTKGFIIPRMNTSQRNTIVNPVQGLQIYNTDDRCIDIFDGTKWSKNCDLKQFAIDSILADSWRPRADFGGQARGYAVGFSINDRGYIGTGLLYADIGGTLLSKDFWEYNSLTNTWAQKADFDGTARSGAVGFSIIDKGYIGTGSDNSGSRKDFWEYNPALNQWTQKADVGGDARSSAVGFSIDTKGFIGTGYTLNGTAKKDFWEYNPISNTWIQKADVGNILRYSATGFSTSTKGYIGTGTEGGGSDLADFWEFTPNGGGVGTWIQKTNFPTGTTNAKGMSIAGVGYVLNSPDFYMYNPTGNSGAGSWIQKADCGTLKKYGAASFGIGNNGYISTGSGSNSNSFVNEFWQYNTANIVGHSYEENIPNDVIKYKGHDWISESNKLYTSTNGVDLLIRGKASIEETNTLEFGEKLSKEENAGKIGYNSFSDDALDIVGAGFFFQNRIVRIYDQLYLPNLISNKRFLLWETGENDHQFFGLGINSGTLRFQIPGSGDKYEFFRGNSAFSSTSIFSLFGNGNATLSGTLTQNSDATLKKNITPISSSFSSLLALQGYLYNWKDKEKDPAPQSGFLAQEVVKLFPHLVNEDANGFLSVNYIGLIPYVVEALKEMENRNKELIFKNDNLQLKMKAMEEKYQELLDRIVIIERKQ